MILRKKFIFFNKKLPLRFSQAKNQNLDSRRVSREKNQKNERHLSNSGKYSATQPVWLKQYQISAEDNRFEREKQTSVDA